MNEIPINEIRNFLHSHYGINPEIKPLPGYDDLNFILSYEGKKSILKITSELESEEVLKAQIRTLNYLNDIPKIGSYVPEVIPGLDGKKLYSWEIEGKKVLVRRLTFLEGKLLGDCKLPTSFYSSLGVFIAQLDKELLKLDEQVFQLRNLDWDLFRFLESEDLTRHIADPYNRTLVEYFFMRFREVVTPVYPLLRKSIIHNDINEWNLLISKNNVAGLIDFGDMVHTATIHELAIAMAYSLMYIDEPLPVAFELVKAYHSILPLQREELNVLYYLIAARLCISLVMSAKKESEQPDNEYCQVSAKPAWGLLHKWIQINPSKALSSFMEACGMDNSGIAGKGHDMITVRHEHIPKSLSVSYSKPIKMIGSALQYMYDDEGRTYLDGVNNIPHVGHCHPRVVTAGQKQMATLNTNTRYLYDSLNEYAEKLLSKFPDPLNKIVFVNSGSAATDLAVRLAQSHTGRKGFIVLDHAYHGNIRSAIELSPYKFNSKGGSGKADNIHIAPIPDTYRGKYRVQDVRRKTQDTRYKIQDGRRKIPDQVWDRLQTQDVRYGASDHLAELKAVGKKYAGDVEKMISGDEVLRNNLAGFIAESIPGCGGQIILPDNYLDEVYKTVRESGGLCIADEVQTGFGRVGKTFWGFELYDVIPDIVILGKPMGNGHPIGAVVFSDDIAKSFENGLEFFSSFGGNPVSCEIGLAVLNAIEEDGLQENARKVGEFLISELLRIQKEENRKENPVIGNIRCTGLFIGIELVMNLETREPNPDMASLLVEEMKRKDILLSTDGPDKNVIKFKPPLCFTIENAKELAAKLESAFSNL